MIYFKLFSLSKKSFFVDCEDLPQEKNRVYFDSKEEALEKATRATSNETIQVDAVRTHARQLLNKAQPDPMTFSFDGENANKIIRNPLYQFAWAYSLDGGIVPPSFFTLSFL